MEGQDNNQQQTPAGEPYLPPQQANPYQPQANPYQQSGQYNPYQPPQQPNPYQQGYYGQPPVLRQNNGYAIAGLVLGIVSIGFCWSWYIGFPVGAAGLVLSIFAKKHGPKKMAIAGLICSIAGLMTLIGIFGYAAWCSYW